jgi:hypothetical protein
MQDNRPTRHRAVSVEAKPEPVTIDIARTAALVVDMQNDFGAKGGMFDRAGIDISITRGAIEPTARALAAVRRAGIPVVYLKHGHRPDLSDLGPPDSPHRIKHLPMAVGAAVTAPDGRESRVLIRDTWNTDILDEVKPAAEDTVIYNRGGEGSVLGLVGGRARAGNQHVEDGLGLQAERSLKGGHAELRQCERARSGSLSGRAHGHQVSTAPPDRHRLLDVGHLSHCRRP